MSFDSWEYKNDRACSIYAGMQPIKKIVWKTVSGAKLLNRENPAKLCTV